MAHRNARLTFEGRRLLVHRVLDLGWAVAHAAKAQGISRRCAHRWLARYDTEGEAGLHDRSSRPHTSPSRTVASVEAQIVEARRLFRRGPEWIGAELGVPARTVSRVLRRHNMPYLTELDPLTGEVIRASKATAVRYERDTPGDLIHVDVKKLGRIPDGGGWKAHGRGKDPTNNKANVGFDFIHSAVDDHTRLAYSEIHPDEKGDTCAGFLHRAAQFFAQAGIAHIREVMTDNHWSYTHSNTFAAVIASIGARHITIRPHCPWQNGKVERFNRTLQTEWAYRQVFTSNSERTELLAPWLEYYNTQRRHTALGGHPPITRLLPT